MGFLEFLSPWVGVDLGTVNTRVTLKHKGIVLRVPSVIARDDMYPTVVYGQTAQRLLDRSPVNIRVIRPVQEGVIADLESAYHLLRHVLTTAQGHHYRTSPRLVLAVPTVATSLERRALQEIALRVGVQNVYIVEAAMAAAIGADLSLENPVGHLIVNMGGGTTEVAVLSLMGVVTSHSIRVGGNHMNQSICQTLKHEYDLLVGQQTAQTLKHQLGSAYEDPQWDTEKLEIGGRSTRSGLPTTLTLTGTEVRDIIHKDVALIVATLQRTLEQIPPELASDISTNGLILSGGGSLLKGLDTLMSREMGIFVHVVSQPLDCVALGLGHILANHHRWDRVLTPLE